MPKYPHGDRQQNKAKYPNLDRKYLQIRKTDGQWNRSTKNEKKTQ
jgi:hypothetical protein